MTTLFNALVIQTKVEYKVFRVSRTHLTHTKKVTRFDALPDPPVLPLISFTSAS